MRRIINSTLNSPFFELIPIAAEPIRELWIKRYRLLEKKLEKQKREWKLFEQDSLSHYQKWYHSTFWNELGKVNDWNEKAREQQKIMMAMVAHQQIYQIDELEAYARVKERLRNKVDAFPDAEDIERFEKQQRERAEAEQRRQEKRRVENQRRQQEKNEKFWASQADAESYSEEIADAFTKLFESGRETFHSPREETVIKRQDDLKMLYRSIVRVLHPDTGHEMSAIEKEWWQLAQDAYRRSDLETLKLIALKIQGAGTVSIENIEQIGTLIDLCAAIIDQQDQIERQKRRMKKDPVYRFWISRSRPANRDKLMFEIRAELQTKFRHLRDFVAEVKSRLVDLEHMSRHEYFDDGESVDTREKIRSHYGGSRGRGRGRGRGRSL